MEGNGDIKLVLDLLTQVKTEVNSRFDKLDTRYDSILAKVSDIDRSYVTRPELQASIKQVVDEFARITAKMEGIFSAMAAIKPVVDDIVPRLEHEARWAAFETRFAEIEETIKDKRRDSSALRVNLLSGLVGVSTAAILQFIFSYFKH